ncbi:hypothetical protein F5B22DRAFT_655487 [Xylaria bambusicola]|uniref:uncharacterized protein n=1 Tax=Xylaria bambusicola TaxID=326684 RepID=UPI002007CD48|nr:uncharacterized protein F5B22DRAFT_655487 [Xylaria bambusicola]KAI0526278.1 hypothetical protein F5B22DRAFT_655487 [Xylaria bambusicola]
MRTQTFITAAVLALFGYATAEINIELYPNSEDCTGEKIVLTTTGCQDVEIRGSAKVISGGTWAYSGRGCTSLQTGTYLPEHGCFITYPVYFSWNPVNRFLACVKSRNMYTAASHFRTIGTPPPITLSEPVIYNLH